MLNACVMKRPRYDEIVDVMNKLGVTINFITDGIQFETKRNSRKNQKMIYTIAQGEVQKEF